MKKKYPLIILILSWAITSIAILSIAFFIEPKSGDNHAFWYRVIWTECLSVIFWFSATGWFNIQSSKVVITPAISVLFTTICTISFVLMILEYRTIKTNILSEYHIAFQIGLFAFAGLLYLGICLANHYSAEDMSIPIDAAKSPSELANSIMNIEKTISLVAQQNDRGILVKNLKTLREKIMYSFFDTTKTRSHAEYKNFASDITALCNSFKDVTLQQGDISKEKLDDLLFSVNTLLNYVDSLSSTVKKA